MEKNVKMPKLRPEMERGVLCAWLKEEGDTVTVTAEGPDEDSAISAMEQLFKENL